MMTTVYLLFILALLYVTVIYNVGAVCYKKCKCLESYVNCSNTLLDNFPELLPSWIEYLDLSSNRIGGSLNIDTDNYLHLTTLNLNKNSLISFPFFKNKTNINNLNLAHNNINKFNSTDLENLPSLEILDMNKNKLVFLDDHIFPKSIQLRTLNLNNNLISNISANSLDSLINLTELKMSHNRLHYLPNGLLKKLKNLELLDLSKNKLTVIEGLLFKNLLHLKTLLLRQNNIGDLPDGAFYGLTKLQSLRLDYNNLSKISKGWLYGLNSLIYLNISNNKIEQINSEWEYCENLKELDLSYNKLQYIDKYNLENLRKLQRLYLNNNKLSFIEEGSFYNTQSLQILIIDHNHLSWMIEDAKESFIGLTNMKKLSLVNNKILYIKNEAFYGLNNLDELNLLQNNIMEIQEEAFKYMPNLVYLYLNSSSLVCDCSLSWLKKPKVFENPPFKFINGICDFPKKNKGKHLDEVPITDFTCIEDNPKPKLIFHPESKIALERQNITLRCGVNSTSTEKMNFIWKKNNHILEFISTNHYSSFEFSGVTQYSILNLYNLSMSQSGEYQCVAFNAFGITYSNHSILTVVVFPYFIKVPRNSSVKTGLTAKLECSANGYPAPEISWQKDGGNDFPAAQERRMKVLSKDDAFLIVNLKLVDMGIYSCTAKNVGGTVAANATLTVLEPPRFGSVMLNKQVKVGEKVVLECLSYGSPRPKTQWMKDGDLLTSDNRHYITSDGQLLIIMETNADDAGIYRCEIANSLGIKIQEVEILIIPLYRSLFHNYALWLVIIVVVICIIITSAIWLLFIYRVRRDSPNLITENKLINTTNSKDTDTGETPKTIPIQLNNKCLNTCQQLNKETEDLSPETTSPLLPHSTVILGESSVKYRHSKIDTLPINLPTKCVPVESSK